MFSLIRDCMCGSTLNLVLSLAACAWTQFVRSAVLSISDPHNLQPIAMVLLRVIKYLVGCVVRACLELSQNMCSLNKMFKYHLLEVS